MPRYQVNIYEEVVAEVVKELRLFRPKYTITGPDWKVNGDFWAHEYVITENEIPVVKISKKWLTWGDTYELDIDNSENEVLAIDSVLESQSSNNS